MAWKELCHRPLGKGIGCGGLGFSTKLDGSGGHYDVYQPTESLAHTPAQCREESSLAATSEKQKVLLIGKDSPHQTRSNGTHKGIVGVKVTLGLHEGQEVIVTTQLVLSELLKKSFKKLQKPK